MCTIPELFSIFMPVNMKKFMDEFFPGMFRLISMKNSILLFCFCRLEFEIDIKEKILRQSLQIYNFIFWIFFIKYDWLYRDFQIISYSWTYNIILKQVCTVVQWQYYFTELSLNIFAHTFVIPGIQIRNQRLSGFFPCSL